jgi:hypothetical protein
MLVSGLTALMAFSYSPLVAFAAATIGQIAVAMRLGRRKTATVAYVAVAR